ncbi:hypothetical protein uav_172 [Pseudomonas phage UAVern]|uniref:Uncharacterized protein n=1 Tax=Pseudomonas phage UAVern TaxID=2856997 RepID=A0A975YYQ6_9CAUD|nr:hypothetical protein uav_172 [Pseudomonas phage UAVern]
MNDYQKVLDVIHSCKTSAQNNVAYAMVLNYEKKYPHNNILSTELHYHCELNLIEIMTRACV